MIVEMKKLELAGRAADKEKILAALEAKDPAAARQAVAHDISEAARYMLQHAKFMASDAG